jgi:hypothetical protein
MSNIVTIYFDGVATDVTQFVRTVSCKRGRNRELDRFSTGTAQITLNNEDRRFDPLYSDGPYFGKLKPRSRVTVVSNAISVFDGFIEDWNLDYSISGKSNASITCVDGLALLAQTALESTTFSQEVPKERIESVLARPEVSYAGSTDLDPGFNILQGDTVSDGTDTLNYLDLVAATDLGRLFVDGAGVLRYRDRTSGIVEGARVVFASESDPYVQQLSLLSNATLWFDAANPDPVRIDDDAKAQTILQSLSLWFDASDPDYIAPVIPFSDVEIELGSEFLFNRIQITRAGGSLVTAENTASVAEFGLRTYSTSGLLFLDDFETERFAVFLASLYGEPDVRISRHGFRLHGLSDVLTDYMLRLEIGDVVRTIWTPNDVGEALDRFSLIEGIEHQIGVDTHIMRVQLTPFSRAGFILDDPNRGLLDTSELTF